MLFRDLFVFICLSLPGLVLNKITVKFGAIMPQRMTFNYRDYKAATFHSIHGVKKNRMSKFNRYFNIPFDQTLVGMTHFSPQEVLEAFCTDILQNDINAVIIINNPYLLGRHQALEGYIFRLAGSLGLPVLSWNAQHSVADRVSEESMILEFAPSIDHQVQALLTILRQYDWPAFSVVTSTLSGYKDFLNLLRQKTRTADHWYGIGEDGEDLHRRFEILYELILTDKTQPYLQRQLLKVKNSDTRIILLYASMKEAREIMTAAANVSLTDPRYMWLVTQATVERLERKAPREFPRGMLGIQFIADGNAMTQMISSAADVWVSAMTAIANEGVPKSKINTIKPNMSCSAPAPLYWKDGTNFFKYLRNVTVRSRYRGMPEISFDGHGVLKYTKLNITNLKPNGYWAQIGSWDKNGLILNDISWPGGKTSPPSGKPAKYHLRVMTLKEEPYVTYSELEADGTCGKRRAIKCRTWIRHGKPGEADYYTNGTKMMCCTGLAMDLLALINRTLGFDFTLYDVEDGLWGGEDRVTREWNGLVRALMDGKADMVVTSLKITPERNQKVEFSVPYLETGITIIVGIRDGAISATAFLEPFDITAWILILLLCIHVVAFMVFTFEYTSPNGLDKGHYTGEPYDFPAWCLILVFSVHAIGASIFIFEWLSPQGLNQGKTPIREHKFSLFRSFWLIWSMLFQATVSVDNPRGVSSRFLANVWALFALVFLASYTANLAAFMITKEEYWDLTGITDLRIKNPYVTKPPFRFATVPYGSTETNLINNYLEVYNYMKKFNKSSVDEGIAAVKRNAIDAFIYDATVLEYKAGKDKFCKLRTVGNWYARTGYGVAFPFGSKWINPVNQVIMQLQEDGELERLQRFWMAGACSKTKKKGEKSHKLGIPNFTSAFILLLMGMLLGAILLTMEHAYFKFGRGCLRKWDRCGCCGLVSLSMGKSLTFEQSVMEAIAFHKTHKCKDARCETQLWKVRHELDLALLKIDRLQETLNDSGVKTDGRAVWRLDSPAEDDRRTNQNRLLQPNGMTRYDTNPSQSGEPSQSRRMDSTQDIEDNRGSPNRSEYTTGTWPVRRSPSYTSAMLGGERNKSPTKVRYHNGNYYVEVDDNVEMETVL